MGLDHVLEIRHKAHELDATEADIMLTKALHLAQSSQPQ
jgi:hypothetical protein